MNTSRLTNPRRQCSISEDRAKFLELSRQLDAYSKRREPPPRHLAARHKELLDHFISVSQGR